MGWSHHSRRCLPLYIPASLCGVVTSFKKVFYHSTYLHLSVGWSHHSRRCLPLYIPASLCGVVTSFKKVFTTLHTCISLWGGHIIQEGVYHSTYLHLSVGWSHHSRRCLPLYKPASLYGVVTSFKKVFTTLHTCISLWGGHIIQEGVYHSTYLHLSVGWSHHSRRCLPLYIPASLHGMVISYKTVFIPLHTCISLWCSNTVPQGVYDAAIRPGHND